MWGSLGAPPSFLVGDHRTGPLLGKQTTLAFCLRQAGSREEDKINKIVSQGLTIISYIVVLTEVMTLKCLTDSNYWQYLK